MSDTTLGPPEPVSGGASRGPALHDPFLFQAAPPPRRRTPWLAIVAVTMTVLFLAASGVAAWLWRGRVSAVVPPLDDGSEQPGVAPSAAPPGSVAIVPPALPSSAPSAPSAPAPSAAPSFLPSGVPTENIVTRRGAITVVDLGIRNEKMLAEEMALQRAAAAADGQTLLVMTTQFGHPLFADVDAALPDPLMQAALDHVRLVRVDVRYFQVDLDELGMATPGIPWFFLLAPDLTPRDGIDGGEWDDDIARNIAPVLGSFVKGTYRARRHTWSPPRRKGGMQL